MGGFQYSDATVGFPRAWSPDGYRLSQRPVVSVEDPQPTGPEPIVITHYDELSAFAASKAFWSKQPLVLAIPSLSAPEALEAGERLNTYRRAFGAEQGMLWMAAGFLICLAGWSLRYGFLSVPVMERLPLALFAAAVSGAAGKVIGVALGRRRARREVARLLAAGIGW